MYSLFAWLLHDHQVPRYIWSKYWWSWQVFGGKQQYWLYGENIEVETPSTNSTKHPWSKPFALLHLEGRMIVVSLPKVFYSAQFILWFYKFMLLDCKLSWWHKIYDLGKGRAKKWLFLFFEEFAIQFDCIYFFQLSWYIHPLHFQVAIPSLIGILSMSKHVLMFILLAIRINMNLAW